MEFRQLKYFTAIAEEGTMSAAAKKLHISQPPLSQQMRALEEELRIPLFDRSARQIQLTEAGQMLYGYASGILELAASIEEGVENFRNGREGSVRIGMVSSAVSDELFTGFSLFRDLAKGVKFKVFDGNTYEHLEALKNGRIDLAVLRTPFHAYGLQIAKIRKDYMMACGVSSYFSNLSDSMTMEDLQDVPLLVYRRWEKFIVEVCDRKGVTPNIFCVADDSRTCLLWAKAGLGVAIVPEAIAATASGMTVKLLAEENLVSELVIAKREDAVLPKSAEMLFDFLKSRNEKVKL